MLAQRHVERLGEPQHHLPARTCAGELQKAQMALRDAGAAGQLELRQAAMLAPPAQPRGKVRVLFMNTCEVVADTICNDKMA